MKNPVNDPLIVDLHKIIKKVGQIAQIHYDNLRACIQSGIWSEEEILQWAQHFAEDPWRNENKKYKTVAHFLRNPEEWMESKKVEEAKPWTL